MHKFEVEEKLHKVLKKLFKKDKKRYEIVWKKITEVVNNSNIEHYKNLRFPMNNFKRVHIDKSFILIFNHDKIHNKIKFYDLDHHDNIYNKKF
ncbi:addiction module toxin RelE [Candidatus Pacearchaeota archaeon]|jgi:YafQ family addiction module toxin component|nr:addiction module toxin RelE [Candidatus Pacearchaeota archaeon]|tara:strand:+ start:18484 stop:18762 length:279 start_codon:yes stop_codon:yes gene_type:complete